LLRKLLIQGAGRGKEKKERTPSDTQTLEALSTQLALQEEKEGEREKVSSNGRMKQGNISTRPKEDGCRRRRKSLAVLLITGLGGGERKKRCKGGLAQDQFEHGGRRLLALSLNGLSVLSRVGGEEGGRGMGHQCLARGGGGRRGGNGTAVVEGIHHPPFAANGKKRKGEKKRESAAPTRDY